MLSRLFGNKEFDCGEVKNFSSEYIEGNLPPSRLEKLRAHLSGCPPCQSFVDGLSSMVGMLSKLPNMQVPPGLKQSIIEHTTEEGKSKGDGV